jgi:putative glutamine amidotransferase
MAIYQNERIIPIHGIRPTYIQKLIKYNLLPIFVSPSMSWVQIEEIYKLCDGVYFIGGEDFNPSLYGQKKHPKTMATEKKRDSIEIRLLKQALKDRKPFLGICRGIHALAIACGGSLIQHIPDRFPKENNNPNKCYDDLLTSAKHPVFIKKDSKVYKLIKKREAMVNSFHHQAVDRPGKGLRIVGKSPSGVVEILEHEDADYFCIGIQSHPEAEENSPFEKIFQEFAKEVSK